MEKYFLMLSYVLSLSGTVILAFPLIKTKRDLDDDLLLGGGKEIVKGKEKIFYTRVGYFKDRRMGLWGLSLLFVGFLIQFLLIIV